MCFGCSGAMQKMNKKEEDKVFSVFKKDEILELVRLKKEYPEGYRRMLKDISEVLKDVAEVVEGVNK